MIIAIIILSVLFVASLAIIFWLYQVLKNTFSITEDMMDMIENKVPRSLRTAYDGKYYPATAIVKMEFGSPHEMVITDFSLYDSKKIVGFTIYTTDSIKKFYSLNPEELEEEDIEILTQPVMLKNVVVYAPAEGLWTWKSAE